MIDWERVLELKNDILCEDFPEVFDLFLEEVKSVLTRLRSNPRPNSLEDEFHFLKGSAINVGFVEFADLCAQAEKAAAMGNGEAIEINAVLNAFDASLSTFMERKSELGLAA